MRRALPAVNASPPDSSACAVSLGSDARWQTTQCCATARPSTSVLHAPPRQHAEGLRRDLAPGSLLGCPLLCGRTPRCSPGRAAHRCCGSEHAAAAAAAAGGGRRGGGGLGLAALPANRPADLGALPGHLLQRRGCQGGRGAHGGGRAAAEVGCRAAQLLPPRGAGRATCRLGPARQITSLPIVPLCCVLCSHPLPRAKCPWAWLEAAACCPCCAVRRRWSS